VEPAASKGGRGKGFILIPQKLAVGNLPVEIGTSKIGNRNIRNLKYSHDRKNQTLQFRKLDCLVFPGSVRCVVYEAIIFHSSHLSF
jgi:hypothetical protein